MEILEAFYGTGQLLCLSIQQNLYINGSYGKNEKGNKMLSHQEELREIALDRALRYIDITISESPKRVVDIAKEFEKYIEGEKPPKVVIISPTK